MIAQRIREFFSVLFGSRRIEDLKDALAKTEKERDYFRGRADRLELMLLGTPRLGAERRPVSVTRETTPIGRKFWPQVQAEYILEQQEKAAKEEAAKKKGN